ncbi:MAG: septal ring lytic transglycosylase RlpA family protein [Aestuariivirga sp.]|jgi:rare lipoprotein A
MRKLLSVTCILLAMSVTISGCSSNKSASRDPFAGIGSPRYKGDGPVPMGGGRYHVGEPYQVAGRWFKPKEQPNYDKTGPASWYGEAFNRRMTSNGEWFDMTRLTAAHPTLPLPSYAKVTNVNNGKTVVVRINDRGPFVGPRIIDLSKQSASALGFKQQGTATVRVQYIGPAPLNDDGSNLMAMNEELERGTPLRQMIAAAGGKRRSEPVQLAQADPVEEGAYQAEPEQQVIQFEPNIPSPVNYFVQAGTFADPDNAERLRQEFVNIGPVQVAELMGNDGPVYRMRVGPFDNINDAQVALNQVHGYGLPDAHLLESHLQQASLQ